MQSNTLKTVWVCFLILFIERFHRFLYIGPLSELFPGMRYYIIVIFLIFALTRSGYSKNITLFKKELVLYVMLISINFATCYVFRGQSPLVSFEAWFPFFLIFFYPTFNSWNLSVKFWENIIEKLFVLFLVCYLLQFLLRNSIQLFNLDSEFEYLQREVRIRIYSDTIMFLGALYSFNKYLAKNKTMPYLPLFIIGTLCIFLQGFRMLILCYTIICLLMFAKFFKISLKSFIFIFMVIGTLYAASTTKVVQDKIGEIVERNEKDNFDNETYCRVGCITYFTSQHFKDNVEYVLGSGMPLYVYENNYKNVKSQYSKEISDLGLQYHWYPVDWGLIGLSWFAGIPFTFYFIFILLSLSFVLLPKEYMYIGFWEFFLVIIGITNEQSYYHSNIIWQAVILTLLTSILSSNNIQCKKKMFWYLRRDKL